MQISGPFYAATGLGRPIPTVGTGPLTRAVALGRPVSPRLSGVVLIGPQLTPRAAPVLAAPSSRSGCIASPSARAKGVRVRRVTRTKPSLPSPPRYSASQAPCRLPSRPSLVLATSTSPLEVTARSVAPAPPSVTAQLPAEFVRLRVRPRASRRRSPPLLKPAHGARVTFPRPKPCLQGLT